MNRYWWTEWVDDEKKAAKHYEANAITLPFPAYRHITKCIAGVARDDEKLMIRFHDVNGKALYFFYAPERDERKRTYASIPALLELSVEDGQKYLQTLYELAKARR